MLTNRGRMVLAITSLSLLMGLLVRDDRIAYASLVVVLWLAMGWLRFQWLCLSTRELLRDCQRSVDGKSGQRITLCTDQQFLVQVTATVSKWAAGYRIWLRDTPPDHCRIVEGDPLTVVDLGSSTQLNIRYVIQPDTCGHVGVAGIKAIIGDRSGFFFRQQFVPCRQEWTVLPFLIRPQTTATVLKQNNVQLQAGHHRYRRAGLSSELLGIRDYVAGDPPRNIAWKPTARLGRLMTCEFESEVPIRATLLVDLSSYQYSGRPGPAVADRVIAATASIARLLLSDRDPVAAVLVTESGSTRLPHGSGERQLTRLLQRLLSDAGVGHRLENAPIDELVHVVFQDCSQRFPQLFDEHVFSGHLGLTISGVRLLARKRRQLVVVLSHLLRLDPASPHRLHYDDDAMRRVCLRYAAQFALNSTALTWPPDLDRLKRAERQAVRTTCQRMLEAHTRANDNELFVLVGRAPLDRDSVTQLENAVRVVRAGHHRLIFVDAGVDDLSEMVSDPLAKRILTQAQQTTPHQRRQLWFECLTKLGAKHARLDDPRLMETVATEVELVRSGRIRASGSQSGGAFA